MNRYLLQLQLRWRLILNNRKLTLIMLILPLVLSTSISQVFRDYSAIDHIPIALVDEDLSYESAELTRALKTLQTLEVSEMTRDTSVQLLEDNRIEAAFAILPGYGQMIRSGQVENRIELIFLESNMVAAALGDIVAREVIQDLVVYSAGNKAESLLGSPEAKALAMERTRTLMQDADFTLNMDIQSRYPRSDEGLELPSTSPGPDALAVRFLLGMLLASTAFYMVFIGASLIEERHQAFFSRLKIAGQPRLTGAFGGFATFGFALISLQMTLAQLMVPIFGWSVVTTLAFALLAYVSCLCGIMIYLSTFFDKSSAFQSLAAPGVFFICLAGGAFWSLELIPEAFLWVSRLSPVYWTMDALIALVYQSHPQYLPLFVLLALGPVLALMAEKRLV